jgi:hypothetical protein
MSDNIEERIHSYVRENKPHVCILTPCYGSVCFVNYVHCLLRTKEIFEHFNIKLKIEFCKNDSLVSRARNNLIAKAMVHTDVTHIMFIDNDITWDPINIIKLIIANKPVIGGIYPLKNYDWDKILDNKNIFTEKIENKNNSPFHDIITDRETIQHNLLNYNVNFIKNQIDIQQNIAEVKHVPTGFMMIQRNTIEKMMEAYTSTKYTDDVGFLEDHENKYAFALFDCGVEDNHYLSEDWLFCNRWNRIGGSLWIDVSINLSHSGLEDYHGSLLSTLL